MRIPRAVNYTITAAVILVMLAMLGGHLLGQPMLIFVETDSMAAEPANLAPGDGYVAIPKQFVGEIQEGDVILFDAEQIGDGGGLTTHRVVDVTEEGYITKGDNNPFTDQDGGEPPVVDGQVRSVAVQFGNDLLVLPGIGVGIEVISGALLSVATPIGALIGIEDPDSQTVGVFVLAAGLVVLVLSMLTEDVAVRTRVRQRKDLLENVFVVIAVLTLVVVIPLNISMLLPSGVYSFEIVSSSEPSEQPGVIEAGESEEVAYVMQNSGHLPMVVFLEPASPGVEIPNTYYRIPPRSSVEAGVIMSAPAELGPHQRIVQEQRYLMALPPSIIASLHAIHPLAAIGAINAVVAGLVTLVTVLALGTDRDRSRVRTRELSWLDRLLR